MSGFTPDIEKIKKVMDMGMKVKNNTPKCGCGGGCC
jgi:hypothetical protein